MNEKQAGGTVAPPRYLDVGVSPNSQRQVLATLLLWKRIKGQPPVLRPTIELEVLEEIAQRVARGELQQELRKVGKMADEVLSWDYGHSNVLSDDITLYEDAQELGRAAP